MLYLGSLGPDYLLDEMVALFRQFLVLKPRAQFLFVSNNGKELVDNPLYRFKIDWFPDPVAYDLAVPESDSGDRTYRKAKFRKVSRLTEGEKNGR